MTAERDFSKDMNENDASACKQIMEDELLLLSAMYQPNEFEISNRNFDSNDIGDIQTIVRLNIEGASVEAVFQYSLLYPLYAWPTVLVRSECINAAEFNKQLRAYIEQLNLGEPQTVNIIQWIQENLIKFLKTAHDGSNKETSCSPTTDATVCYERLWIYSHHLRSPIKRRKIPSEAKALKLRGFSIPGKPGIIVVEGVKENCQIFWETIIKYGWKKLVIRYREAVDEGKFLKLSQFKEILLPSGDGKTVNYSDLKKLLIEMDIGYGFEKLLNIQ